MPDLAAPARPAHLWVPPGARGNYGDEVADVARMVGRPLDPAQRIAVDALTSYGPGGRWLALEGCVKLPRQNGKTGGIVTPIVLADLFLFDADRIAWTAHLFKTTREAFADHKQLIQSTPEFDRRVRKIHEANGEESIELTTGARIDYLARSKGGGRGLGGKRVVMDEALFGTGEQAGAILPILAARDDPQITYASSACKTESGLLRRLTKRGRAGGDPSLVFVEWTAPGGWDRPGCTQGEWCTHQLGVAGCALDDPVLAAMANPAMASGRIDPEFLVAMRRTLPPLEFGREFLGWDEAGPEDDEGPIPLEDWDACLRDSLIVGGKLWAVDVTPAGTRTSIGVAGRNAESRAHLELVKVGEGTTWAVDELLRLIRTHETRSIRAGEQTRDGLILDPAGPAAELVPALQAAGLNPYLAGVRDVAQGCAALLTGVRDRTVVQIGQQQVRDALQGAARRDVGDGGWALARRHSAVDISPAMVMALGLQALRLAEAAPPPPFFASRR